LGIKNASAIRIRRNNAGPFQKKHRWDMHAQLAITGHFPMDSAVSGFIQADRSSGKQVIFVQG
jgi:hypothetical protein